LPQIFWKINRYNIIKRHDTVKKIIFQSKSKENLHYTIKCYSNTSPLIIRFPKMLYLSFIFSILISAAKFVLNHAQHKVLGGTCPG
jgi:hypothetical protein